MSRAIVIAVGLVLATSGCSFVFVSGPPANHRQLPVVECTTSRLAPGLDAAWTILQVLNFALAVSRTDKEWDDTFGGEPPFSRSTGIGLYTAWALLGGAGMYFGFTRTGACIGAKQEAALRQSNGQQPSAWPPPAPQQPPPAPGWPPPPPPTAPPAPPPVAPPPTNP